MSVENKIFRMIYNPKKSNMFIRFEATTPPMTGYATSSNVRRFSSTVSEESIVTPIQVRIAVDASQNVIKHVIVDEIGRIQQTIFDERNDLFNYRANIDQTGSDIIKDFVLTMLRTGVAVLVPVDYDGNMYVEGDVRSIREIRVGTISEWFYRSVRVRIFNPDSGNYDEIILPKNNIAIVTNPFSPVMNEGNSVLKRLCTKMGQQDDVDERSSSGKLNMVIRLPFTARGEKRIKEATNRVDLIQRQLNANNEYGIAYIDASEEIIQLNRPIDNSLTAQIETLKKEAYSQYGMTEAVFNGTASEEEMKNYYSRTVQPILKALTDELNVKFLTREEYQNDSHRFKFFIDAFSYVSVSSLADAADKFVTSEILSPNDIRSTIGFPPDSNESSDELRNRHINQGKQVEQDAAKSEATVNEDKQEMRHRKKKNRR